jgi:hypothetical protein
LRTRCLGAATRGRPFERHRSPFPSFGEAVLSTGDAVTLSIWHAYGIDTEHYSVPPRIPLNMSLAQISGRRRLVGEHTPVLQQRGAMERSPSDQNNCVGIFRVALVGRCSLDILLPSFSMSSFASPPSLSGSEACALTRAPLVVGRWERGRCSFQIVATLVLVADDVVVLLCRWSARLYSVKRSKVVVEGGCG